MFRRRSQAHFVLTLVLTFLLAVLSTHLLLPAEAAPPHGFAVVNLTDELLAYLLRPVPLVPSMTFDSPLPAPAVDYYYAVRAVSAWWQVNGPYPDANRWAAGLQNLSGPQDGAFLEIHSQVPQTDSTDHYWLVVDFGMVFAAGASLEFYQWHNPRTTPLSDKCSFQVSIDGESWSTDTFDESHRWCGFTPEIWQWYRHSLPLATPFRYARLAYWSNGQFKNAKIDSIRVVNSTPLTPDPRRTLGKEDPCLANNPQYFVGDPVNTSSGHFVYHKEDLHIPTRGLPLQFERSYNSFTTDRTALGYGWTHNYNVRLDLAHAPDVVSVIAPRGSWLIFQESGGSYTEVYGRQGSLVYDSGSGTYTWTTGDDVSQVVYHFNSSGQLTSMVDGSGNTTTLQYANGKLSQVLAPDGRSLQFDYTGDLMTSVTDPISRTVHFEYDQGNLVSVQDVLSHTTSFGYDSLSRITVITDTNGYAAVRNEYENGRVARQYDASNYATEFSYTDPWDAGQGSAGAYQTTVTDPLQQATVYRYSAGGLLQQVDSPGDRSAQYQYDPASWNLLSFTDAKGNQVSYQYNTPCACRPSQITDPLGDGVAITNNPLGGYDTVQDAAGNTTEIHYTQAGHIWKTVDAEDEETTFTYDAYGQLSSMTDAENRTMYFEHDSFGDLHVITDSLGYAAHIQYDGIGRPTDVTDPLGRTAHYEYNAAGNVTAVTRNYQGSGQPEERDITTGFGYDNEGNLTSITDAEGRVTHITYDPRYLVESVTLNYQGGGQAEETDVTTAYEYDPVGRLTTVTGPRGYETDYAYEYDDAGRLIVTVTDALDKITKLAYDKAGNLEEVEDPNGNHVDYTYDSLNRVTSISDELHDAEPGTATVSIDYDNIPGTGYVETVRVDGVDTRYEYDSRYRLWRVIEDYGGSDLTTQYGYDAVGNLTAVTNPLGKTVTYAYDERHQLEAIAYPQGTLASRTFSYDELGRLEASINSAGTTALAYDGVDRVTSVQYPNETLIQFAYDRAGNRESMVDGTGSTGYSYDALNRLTGVTAGGETVEYGYDGAGNLTTLTYPENGTVQYSYDALNRLEQVEDWDDSVIASYSYDDAGRLVGGSYGNGWTFARHFDEANRLDQIAYSSLSAQDFYTFTYELDATGNRIKEITQGGEPQEHDRPERRYLPIICKATSLGQSSFVSIVPLSLQFFERTVEYDYDDIGRLDTASAGVSDPTYAYDYEYDDAGNRAAEVRPLATRTFDYDDADRLTAVNGQDYTWDEGKLVSDTLRSFEYDGAGRLAQVISGTLTTQYAYNGDGDRVSSTAGGQTIEYTLDPNGLTNVLEARQGVSVTTYLYGLLGPLAEELPSGQRLYYGRDALGSVRFLLDGTGDIVNRYEYDPYGVHHYAESASINPAFRFGGEQWDAGSGLYYLRARYYDPAQGRFLTRDPFAGLLNLPQTLNPYAYATNNPVNLTDPSGQIVPLILLGVFVAGGFLGGVGAYTIQAYRYPNPCEGVQWDPVHALVWGGGGGLLGLGMYGVGYGGYALAIHFGWIAPGAAPAAIAATRVSVQRYGSTAWNYGRGLLRPAVVRANHSARIVQGPLSRLDKGRIRSQARAILGEVNPDFMKYVDSLGENIEVHHRIPLEYARLFPGEDPNRLTNLYGLSAQFHRQVINPAWTAFRVTNPNPTIEEVLLYTAEVDRLIPWNITLYY